MYVSSPPKDCAVNVWFWFAFSATTILHADSVIAESLRLTHCFLCFAVCCLGVGIGITALASQACILHSLASSAAFFSTASLFFSTASFCFFAAF